jgi:hypothetical protein
MLCHSTVRVVIRLALQIFETTLPWKHKFQVLYSQPCRGPVGTAHRPLLFCRWLLASRGNVNSSLSVISAALWHML